MQEEKCNDQMNDWHSKQPKEVQEAMLAGVKEQLGSGVFKQVASGMLMTPESRQIELERCDKINMPIGMTRADCKEFVNNTTTANVDYISSDSLAVWELMIILAPPTATECHSLGRALLDLGRVNREDFDWCSNTQQFESECRRRAQMSDFEFMNHILYKVYKTAWT